MRGVCEFSFGDPAPAVHNRFAVLPAWVDIGTIQKCAVEIDINLMKGAFGIVKLIHQTGQAHVDAQAAFLPYLAFKVVRQAVAAFNPAARRAHQGFVRAGIGIHQQQPVIVFENGARSKAGAGAGHGLTFAIVLRSAFHGAAIQSI